MEYLNNFKTYNAIMENENNAKLNVDEMVTKISKTLNSILPSNAHIIVENYKTFLSKNNIKIAFAANDTKINNVAGQLPQLVSLSLSLDELDLHIQGYCGRGGQNIYRKPNLSDPKEKYYAMIRVKIPFRKPKPTEIAIMKAIENFAKRWLQALKDNRDELKYQDIVDYDKLLK